MDGNIPTLFVQGRTLPEAWERAVLECWNRGAAVKTEYDRPGDPPSRDCTMMFLAEDPFAEPRLHRAFPGGLEDLEVYRQEVIEGIHDHWIAPEEGKWTYTYHKRLFAYDIEGKTIDQVDYIVRKLSQAGHSRRAQAITWNVRLDPPTNDPPCLQRVCWRTMGADSS
jgi:thymidylate synthase